MVRAVWNNVVILGYQQKKNYVFGNAQFYRESNQIHTCRIEASMHSPVRDLLQRQKRVCQDNNPESPVA